MPDGTRVRRGGEVFPLLFLRPLGPLFERGIATRHRFLLDNLKRAGLLMSLLVAPAALADTCCANVPVVLDPPSAMSGATVRLIGMRCLNYDGTQTNPLKLGRFLLTSRSPEIPGTGPTAAGLPPIEKWLPFKLVPDPSVTTGDALIVVPDLRNGAYQL